MQTVFDVAVVVGVQRDLFIANELFFDGKFFEYILFDGRSDSPGGISTSVVNGERGGVLLVTFDQLPAPSLFDSQRFLKVRPFDFSFELTG